MRSEPEILAGFSDYGFVAEGPVEEPRHSSTAAASSAIM